MEIIKERKFLKILLILGIAFSTIFLFNTKAFAASSTLSVKYNGIEVKQNTPLSLSMKYKSNPIIWNISSNTSWKVYCKESNVISISQDHTKNIISIKPITYLNGNATILIYTADNKISKKYIIQVKNDSYISVQYKQKEVKTNTPLALSMKYKENPVHWLCESSYGGMIISKSNDNIELNRTSMKSASLIDLAIKPLKPGTTTITISTMDKKVVKKYIIQVQAYLSVKMNNQELSTNKYIKLNYMAARYVGVYWDIVAPNGWTVSSSDTKLIYITQDHDTNHIIIWALPRKTGKAKITISTKDKKISRTYLINIE